MAKEGKTWVALGGSALALACVPRVPATLVVTEPEPEPESESEPGDEASKPKRAAGATNDLTPPELIRAEQLSDKLLRLHFSEPVELPPEFDPNDFRLSVFNVYINQREGYSYAYYYDIGYQTYGQPLRFTATRVGQTQLDLYFAPPLMQYYCRQLENQYNYAPPGVHADAGLFLHYSAGSVPIHDEADNPLANFGADWVERGRSDPPQSRLDLNDAAARAAGRDLIRVHCGPEIPPGPR
jgi:hypothetical protein